MSIGDVYDKLQPGIDIEFVSGETKGEDNRSVVIKCGNCGLKWIRATAKPSENLDLKFNCPRCGSNKYELFNELSVEGQAKIMPLLGDPLYSEIVKIQRDADLQMLAMERAKWLKEFESHMGVPKLVTHPDPNIYFTFSHQEWARLKAYLKD